MSWARKSLTALAVCALLPLGAACGNGDAHGRAADVSPAPVGNVLDDTDETGRHLREVDDRSAPEIGIEVTPDAVGGWDVVLTPHHFSFSASGTRPRAVAGHGLAHLFVDGKPVTELRTREYHLAARLVPHGTHHVTARLYADDGTVWAVHGKPVQSTADITASGTEGERGAPASSATATRTAGH